MIKSWSMSTLISKVEMFFNLPGEVASLLPEFFIRLMHPHLELETLSF